MLVNIQYANPEITIDAIEISSVGNVQNNIGAGIRFVSYEIYMKSGLRIMPALYSMADEEKKRAEHIEQMSKQHEALIHFWKLAKKEGIQQV